MTDRQSEDRVLKPRWSLRTGLLPVLAVAVIVTQILAPYRGWRILIVGLTGALILSWLWTLSLAGGLDLTRQMRFGWAQVGDRLVERFTVYNRGWAPANWVEVANRSTLPSVGSAGERGSPGAMLSAGIPR